MLKIREIGVNMGKMTIFCSMVFTVLAGVFFFGCDGSSGDSPGSHMAVLNGVSHLDGYNDPLVNCTECHGAALRGGSGPNCYGCHNSGNHNRIRNQRRHRVGDEGGCAICHGPGNGGGLGPACSSCH